MRVVLIKMFYDRSTVGRDVHEFDSVDVPPIEQTVIRVSRRTL